VHDGGRAWLRLILGCAQMASAVASLWLILSTGVNRSSLAAVAFTTALTLTSRLLFGGSSTTHALR
jgi:hypothetical protein